MYLRQFDGKLGFFIANFPHLQNYSPLEHPHGLEDLWYTDLVLVTMERYVELIIGFVMANLSYIQNFRSLELSHGFEEAPVVH